MNNNKSIHSSTGHELSSRFKVSQTPLGADPSTGLIRHFLPFFPVGLMTKQELERPRTSAHCWILEPLERNKDGRTQRHQRSREKGKENSFRGQDVGHLSAIHPKLNTCSILSHT